MAGSKRLEELASLFSDLQEKSLKSGETVEAIRTEFLREVKNRSASKTRSKKLWFFFILPVVMAAACYHFEVIELLHIREDPCLMTINDFFIEVARKPSNCSLVCEGLKDLFEKNKDAYRINEDECQFFPYRTEFISLEEAMNMSKERSEWKEKPWYFGWSNCDPAVREELRTHYQLPYFLPTQSETSEEDWIFMGGPGPGAQIHIDSVGRPSWQAQLSGQKVWTLIPPPECEQVCQSVTTTIHKGEVFIVDTNQWYHATKILPGDLSITIGAEFD